MKQKPLFWGLLIGAASFILYLFFQAKGIYGGDSGDLVTAAATGGVPHPPGYPLYTFFGWLLNHLPLATPAWRVGLLSSLPHAATIGVVFLFVYQLTKRLLPALFSAMFLAGNYLFFLYSVTPEVFGLFDLFVIVLTYLVYQKRYFAASLVLGLSLTHHHVILFLLPAMVYLVHFNFKFPRPRSAKRGGQISNFKFFLLGLLPYLYIPFAARGNSIINWDRAVGLPGFIKLVTRADYGTFVSGGFYGSELTHRLLALKAYGQFVLLDLSWVGVILAGVGLFWLWRRKREWFWYFSLAVGMLGPLFFFYASFPLVNRFTVGTYERFLLPSYVLLAVLAGVGFGRLEGRAKIFRFIAVLFFLLPLIRGAVTLWRFWGLPQDRTAENLGRDLLYGLPANSILLLRSDTPLFATQYVRYSLGVRPDVAAIHVHRLESDDYPAILAQNFPTLALPPKEEQAMVLSFIEANRGAFSIYSNTKLPLSAGWFWVPQGLVYQLAPEKDLPRFVDLKKRNDARWDLLHNPATGILARYNHLMLSDVRDVYAAARIEYGKVLLRGNELAAALGQFETAADYGGDAALAEAYTYAGMAHLFLGACQKASDAFSKARNSSLVPDKILTLYEAAVARDCEKNPSRAKELFDAYEAARQAEDVSLEAK